jgi:Protein of unknown function (DUF1236)
MDQQSRISEMITKQTPQPLTNIDFQIAKDVVIPSNVALQRLPEEAEQLAPQLKGDSYLGVEELVAIVDTNSRKIISGCSGKKTPNEPMFEGLASAVQLRIPAGAMSASHRFVMFPSRVQRVSANWPVAFAIRPIYQIQRGKCSLPLRLRSNDCAALDLSRRLAHGRPKDLDIFT